MRYSWVQDFLNKIAFSNLHTTANYTSNSTLWYLILLLSEEGLNYLYTNIVDRALFLPLQTCLSVCIVGI